MSFQIQIHNPQKGFDNQIADCGEVYSKVCLLEQDGSLSGTYWKHEEAVSTERNEK